MANNLREIREQPKPLQISKDSDTWAICSSENVVVGVINHRTASHLASLPFGDELAYQAFMEPSKLEKSVESYLRGNKKVQFDIVVNIMGPASIFEAVGQQLSERQLFLQRPYELPEGTAYINPQYLDIDDQPDDATTAYDSEGGQVLNPYPLDEDQILAHGDLDGELWNIMDNSCLPEDMARIEIDQNIHTTLMEYVLCKCQVTQMCIKADDAFAVTNEMLWTSSLPESAEIPAGVGGFGQKISRPRVPWCK